MEADTLLDLEDEVLVPQRLLLGDLPEPSRTQCADFRFTERVGTRWRGDAWVLGKAISQEAGKFLEGKAS